jgi:hypothetical protein
MGSTELVLWLAPTALSIIVLIGVLLYLATRRTDTAEYQRLANRIRLLEADHRADLVQIASFREEIFYLGRLISLLADQLEGSGLALPQDVREYLRQRLNRRPVSANPELVVLIQHALSQFFDRDELNQLSFELGVEFDNLPGSTREAKARELVQFVDRRGQLEILVEHIREMRPNVPLPWRGGRDPP